MNGREKATKFSCSLRPELSSWVDSKRQALGISRSAYIAMCLSQMKQAEEEKPRVENLVSSVTSLINGYMSGDVPQDVAQVKISELETELQALKK